MEPNEEAAPICPLCGIRERSYDDEPPGPGSYFSHCTTCALLSGYRDHSHTYYPNPAQVAAGTYKAGHSWRTLVTIRPLWESGNHIGYRCSEFEQCGWEERFTADDLTPCAIHTPHPDYPFLTGVCRDYQEHRQERGECDGRGWINDHGREQERKRSDAANWDPGGYVKR